MKRILIVAAHPDDEILGCGGTVAKYIDNGFEAFTLILGEGITSRDDSRNKDSHIQEINQLKNNIKKANTIIGVKETFSYDFPDNRFDSVDLLDIIKIIEKIKNDLKPSVIFTHFANDLNIDHTITNRAVLTATRPMQDECVKELYAFEVLSSTEWNYPITFNPDFFIDITKYIERKKEAMGQYFGELRKYPHPRSLEGIELNAQYWGLRTGVPFAEAFKTLRIIK